MWVPLNESSKCHLAMSPLCICPHHEEEHGHDVGVIYCASPALSTASSLHILCFYSTRCIFTPVCTGSRPPLPYMDNGVVPFQTFSLSCYASFSVGFVIPCSDFTPPVGLHHPLAHLQQAGLCHSAYLPPSLPSHSRNLISTICDATEVEVMAFPPILQFIPWQSGLWTFP